MSQKTAGRVRMIAIVLGVYIGTFAWVITTNAAPEALSKFRAQIEADWLRQEKYQPDWTARDRALEVTARTDAAGGCDGIKDGKWGFHTGHAERPWWQVDIGASQPITRVVVWNRTEGTPERAAHLMIRLSDNGKDWRTVYSHNGVTFYGSTDNKPLVVHLKNQKSRFVRIQLPGTTFLHLDEVAAVVGFQNDRDLSLELAV